MIEEKALGNICYKAFEGSIEYYSIEPSKAEMRDGINTYGEMGISFEFYNDNMTEDELKELKELKEFYKNLMKYKVNVKNAKVVNGYAMMVVAYTCPKTVLYVNSQHRVRYCRSMYW